MKELYKHIARPLAVAILPFAAWGCTDNNDAQNRLPTKIARQSATPKPTDVLSRLVPDLAQEQENNRGVILVNFTEYDPGKNLLVRIKVIDPETEESTEELLTVAYDSVLGKKTGNPQVAVGITDCTATFQVEFGFDKNELHPIGEAEDETGELKSTFTLGQQKCYKVFTVNSLFPPNP